MLFGNVYFSFVFCKISPSRKNISVYCNLLFILGGIWVGFILFINVSFCIYGIEYFLVCLFFHNLFVKYIFNLDTMDVYFVLKYLPSSLLSGGTQLLYRFVVILIVSKRGNFNLLIVGALNLRVNR
jgi:hypothetical protein